MTLDTWDLLEQWSSTALLMAGGLYGVDTVFMALDLLTDVSLSGGVFVVLFVSALILTLVAILGFYPSLTERCPRLARISMVPLACAGVLLPLTFGWAIIASLLNRSLPPGSLAALIISLIFLGLILFGVASALSQAPSRFSGVLVLGLVAIWGAWFAGFAVWGPHHLPGWWSPMFSAGTSITILILGFTLNRRSSCPPTRSRAKCMS